ncbi:hypothetical protein DOM21_17390 [Bacteriovorax stolpii]|uniref:helix-turn-helix domain-containing protein n=1 Tax=Bacteriovorax stolpii TaxID=960 RepID=UPI0011576188|nr:hypothetical protein [Bacteriovorax stolpii]QDK43197.1 hypothetical protein DOM21_17390 [Bacteriovorax stolpii]
MNFLKTDDLDFYYGNTCESSDELRSKNYQSSFKKQDFNIRLKKEGYGVKVDLGGIKFAFSATSAKPPKIKDRFVENWSERIQWIEGALGLTQPQLARILNISISTLQKIKSKQTIEPTAQTKKQFLKLLSLLDFVFEKVEDRKFQARAILLRPSLALGNVSVIDYISENSSNGDSISEAEGILRRMLE